MHRHHTDFFFNKLQVSSSALELLEGREGGIQVSSSSLDIIEGGEGGKQEVSSAPLTCPREQVRQPALCHVYTGVPYAKVVSCSNNYLYGVDESSSERS